MAIDDVAWDDLRYLEAYGRLGTAGRAARELGTSASTIYRRIAHLERTLAITCVYAGEGRLTDAGRALADVAAQTRASMRALHPRLVDATRSAAGEVSITTVEGAVPLLAEPLAAVTARHPELTLRLVVGDQGPSVRRREVDLAFSVMPEPPASLWGRRLFTIRYGVFGSEHACAQRPLRWIRTGEGMKLPDRVAWEAAHAEPIVARADSESAVRHLLRAGMGVAVYPHKLGEADEALVELEEHRASLVSLERDAWLLTHPDIRDVERVRVVMDALCEACAER